MTYFTNKLSTRLDQLLANDKQTLLCGGLKGIEKESLRIGKNGFIAQTPHPSALGAVFEVRGIRQAQQIMDTERGRGASRGE